MEIRETIILAASYSRRAIHFLTLVRAFMISLVTALRESFIAEVASERPVAGVRVYVGHQVSCLGETLSTEVASERPLTWK